MKFSAMDKTRKKKVVEKMVKTVVYQGQRFLQMPCGVTVSGFDNAISHCGLECMMCGNQFRDLAGLKRLENAV